MTGTSTGNKALDNALANELAKVTTISRTLTDPRFVNTDPSFSVTLPAGFLYVEGTSVLDPKQFAVGIFNEPSPSEGSPRMGVRMYNTTSTLDEKHASDMAFFRGIGTQIYSDGQISINGIPAYLSVVSVPVPTGFTKLVEMDVRLVANGQFYLVQGGASETDWAKYKKEFEVSLRSFKLN